MNKAYLERGQLEVIVMAGEWRGWTVQAIEKRQGLMVACLEESVYRSGTWKADQLEEIGQTMKNRYGDYLLLLLREKDFTGFRQANE